MNHLPETLAMDQNFGESTDQPTGSSSDNTSPYVRHASRLRFSTVSVATLPQYTPFDASHYTNSNPQRSTTLNHTPSGLSSGNILTSTGFEYTYPNQTNKPWATLKLYTQQPASRRHNRTHNQPRIPHVFSSEPLSGVIQLDIESPINIQQIHLQLKGRIVTSALKEGSYTFVDHISPIWSQSMGDPLKSSHALNPAPKEKFNGKFCGLYSFPFTLPFPTYVDLEKKAAVFPPTYISEGSVPAAVIPNPDPTPPADKKGKKKRPSWSFFSLGNTSRDPDLLNEQPKRHWFSPSHDDRSPDHQGDASVFGLQSTACPMPQSFTDKSLRFNIAYEIRAIFTHGRFRPDTKIPVPIAYVPSSEPAPMSVRRQQAYQTGLMVPGPNLDPEGWFPLPNATIRGFFNEILGAFGKREIAVNYVLYIANPLSYTRGTVIPCYMSLSCIDAKALEVVQNTKSPDVRLVRKLRHLKPSVDVVAENQELVGGLTPRGYATSATATGSIGLKNGLETTLHEVTHAIWWTPPNDVTQDPTERWLEGEIHLNSDLQPSCACSIFSVEYVVELHLPKSMHFEPHPSSSISGKSRQLEHDEPAISSQTVEITTMFREGEPIPISFSEAPKNNSKLRALNVEATQEDSEEEVVR